MSIDNGLQPMKIEEWLEEYAPAVMICYKQSLIPFDDIPVGTKLMALRHGYCGGTGKILQLSSEVRDETYGEFKYRIRKMINPFNEKEQFSLYENDSRAGPWYFQVIILTDEDFEIIHNSHGRAYREWIKSKLGCQIDLFGKFHSVRGWDR